MINNRQGGRRRGRGGPRGSNIGGPPSGNRQDNRQRGNAAQLLEKYKSMARDSQLAGDRVQTEYFLQYAEHYFRVLGESRARYDEQRRQRGDDGDDDAENGSSYNEPGFQHGDEDLEGSDESQGDDEQAFDRGGNRDRNDQRDRDSGDRSDRGDRSRRYSRDDRGEAERSDRGGRNDRSSRDNGAQASRSERPARDRMNGDSIPFDALPPAISADSGPQAPTEETEAVRPRRRVRRPRATEGDGDPTPLP